MWRGRVSKWRTFDNAPMALSALVRASIDDLSVTEFTSHPLLPGSPWRTSQGSGQAIGRYGAQRRSILGAPATESRRPFKGVATSRSRKFWWKSYGEKPSMESGRGHPGRCRSSRVRGEAGHVRRRHSTATPVAGSHARAFRATGGQHARLKHLQTPPGEVRQIDAPGGDRRPSPYQAGQHALPHR